MNCSDFFCNKYPFYLRYSLVLHVGVFYCYGIDLCVIPLTFHDDTSLQNFTELSNRRNIFVARLSAVQGRTSAVVLQLQYPSLCGGDCDKNTAGISVEQTTVPHSIVNVSAHF